VLNHLLHSSYPFVPPASFFFFASHLILTDDAAAAVALVVQVESAVVLFDGDVYDEMMLNLAPSH
jgi:hypothetical protein